MVTVSVCMIVKNEEETLARCLDSLGDIPDEIIIADTGSSDNTKEIAGRYTDKVYDFLWTGDFAAARNFSLSKACCDYIYTADADEVLDAANLHRFRLLKEALTLTDAVEVVEFAYDSSHGFNSTANFDVEYRPKLFKRLRAFTFADPIHEVLRTDPIVFRSDITVMHCPAQSHANRNLAVFARLIQNGGRLSDRLEMMYARELLLAGSPEELGAAKPYFKTKLSITDPQNPSLRRAACVLSRLAVIEENPALLLQAAATVLLALPPAEVCCGLGDYFKNTGDITHAAFWYEYALSGNAPELIAAAAGEIPLNGLAACAELAGDMPKAAGYRDEARKWTESQRQKVDI